MKQYQKLLYLSSSVLVAFLTGCAVPAIVGGGGSMPSEFLANGKATFTFQGDSCDGVFGWINYVDQWGTKKSQYDKANDVKFKGYVTRAGLCTDLQEPDEDLPLCLLDQVFPHPTKFGCPEGWYQVEFDYDSTNPSNRGDGYGLACLKQGSGTGKNKGHESYVKLFSGPYAGYHNGPGPLQGNVKIEQCPEI